MDSLTNRWTCHSLHGALIYLACNATVHTQNEHAGLLCLQRMAWSWRRVAMYCPVKGPCFIVFQTGDAIAMVMWP
ncbi:hypothetical protein IMY05_004G0168500 [Salix suchowensis]|nr:hypothetical protein IMY05_004G0168500 [Salix suchowensis]